jgi:hypothetical protein
VHERAGERVVALVVELLADLLVAGEKQKLGAVLYLKLLAGLLE